MSLKVCSATGELHVSEFRVPGKHMKCCCVFAPGRCCAYSYSYWGPMLINIRLMGQSVSAVSRRPERDSRSGGRSGGRTPTRKYWLVITIWQQRLPVGAGRTHRACISHVRQAHPLLPVASAISAIFHLRQFLVCQLVQLAARGIIPPPPPLPESGSFPP